LQTETGMSTGERLFVAQPSLSQQISLETELGGHS
jgi:hypothetical protein